MRPLETFMPQLMRVRFKTQDHYVDCLTVRGSEESDAEMIRLSLVDGSVFSSIFDRHYPPLHRFLAAHWGQEVGADLASETFLVAFAQRDRFDSTRTSARPWLFGIALNLSRMEARRRRREADATVRDAVRDDLEDFAEGLVDRLDAAQEAKDLELSHALRRLRADDLTILTMSLFGDLTHREIAEALGLPVGTVKSKLHRTVKALKGLRGSEARTGQNRGGP